MPVRFTPLEYLLARFAFLPVPLVDTPLAPGIGKILVTACEMGMFDLLDRHSLPLDALAEKLNCEPQGLQILLELLVQAGYLRKQKNATYSDTRVTQRWLTSRSAVSIAPYIIHSPDIVAIWDHLPEVIHGNKQAMQMPYTDDSPAAQALLVRHYAGLASLATALGRELLYRVSLPRGATRLLDVGGSHAGYSALFCRRYRRLTATILDLPVGIEAGKRTAKLMKLEDRIDFLPANIVEDDFSQEIVGQYDVALYFHIAHLLQPEVNQQVLERVARTLRPGGMLVFVDQVTDQTHGSRLASLMVQFMALSVTAIGGTCHPFETVKQWLECAGLEQVKSHRLFTPGVSMVTAIKRCEETSGAG
jgi:SAM-dependent methyltransferase